MIKIARKSTGLRHAGPVTGLFTALKLDAIRVIAPHKAQWSFHPLGYQCT